MNRRRVGQPSPPLFFSYPFLRVFSPLRGILDAMASVVICVLSREFPDTARGDEQRYPHFLGIAKSARFWEQYPCCRV